MKLEVLGGLQSMGLHRVGHNRSDLAAAANHINIRELKPSKIIYIINES